MQPAILLNSSTLPLDSQRRDRRRYAAYIGLVTVLGLALKIALLPSAPYSATLGDDYDYMYKSICFLDGDWKLETYHFKKTYTPPGYPLLISPWLLFDAPRARMAFISCMSFVFSALVIILGSKIVQRLTHRRSLLVPLCLSVYAPAFLFNYYVMTENVVFLILTAAAWLSIDFELTCRRPARLALLFALVTLGPLMREPCFAILPPLGILLLLHRRSLGWRRVMLIGLGLVACALGPHQAFYNLYSGASRIGMYAGSVTASFDRTQAHSFLQPFKFIALSFTNQIGYIFLSTGYWPIPAILVLLAQFASRRAADPDRAWRNFLLFILLAVFILTCFAELHMAARFRLSMRRATFVVGRYNDPAALLILVAGLAALLRIRPGGVSNNTIFLILAPIALGLMMYRISNWTAHPMHDIGLAAFALKPLKSFPHAAPALALGLVLLIAASADLTRRAAPLAMLTMIAFSTLHLKNGFAYISSYSTRIAKSLDSAEYVVAHLPPDAKIACDARMKHIRPPPGLGKWKTRSVYNLYQVFLLAVYPRPVHYLKPPDEPGPDLLRDFGDAQYLLSVRDAAPTCDLGLPIAWQDELYVLYQIAPSTQRTRWTLNLDQLQVTNPKMQNHRGKLIMAWDNCKASGETPWPLPAGSYEARVRATAEGCPDSPPRLTLKITGRATANWPIEINATREYVLPFDLAADGPVQIELVSREYPPCANKADKNVIVHSLSIFRTEAPAPQAADSQPITTPPVPTRAPLPDPIERVLTIQPNHEAQAEPIVVPQRWKHAIVGISRTAVHPNVADKRRG